MTHHCKNRKFCPICRQKIKKEITVFFQENPKIFVTWYDIAEKFSLTPRNARDILDSLAKRNIIIKKYDYNKRLTVGGGIKTRFTLSTYKFRPSEVKSKTWTNIF